MKRFLLFIFFIPLTSFAQMKPKECYTVYVNYPDYTVKADVFSKDKKINIKRNAIYHWYASNKILETEGGYAGKLLNGSYTSFYLTNNLKEKGCFKSGVKQGDWIAWYENGKIKELDSWNRGLRSNLSKSFDANGLLISVARFKSGKLNGPKTTYLDGKIIESKRYKNGIEVIKNEKIKEANELHHDEKHSIFDKLKIAKGKVKLYFRKKNKKDIKEVEKKKKKEVEKPIAKKHSQSLLQKKSIAQKTQKIQPK